MGRVIIGGTLLILGQTFLSGCFFFKPEYCALLYPPISPSLGVTSANTKDFKCSGGAAVTFNGNAFMGLKKEIITDKTDSEIDISVDVTTTKKDGLILWKRSEVSGDHISLGLVNGFVVFEYNYGREDRKVKIRSKIRVNDGQKHVVNAIKKSGGGGSVAVGFDFEDVESVKPVPAITLDKLDTSEGFLYLGGLPQTMDVNKTTFGSFAAPFIGCISSLVVSHSVSGTTVEVSSAKKDFFDTFLVEGGLGVTCEERCPFTAEKLTRIDAGGSCGEISEGLFAMVASLIATFHLN